MIVHQQTGQSKAAKVGKTTCTTKCGLEFHRNSAAPINPEVTAWPSLVTCEECKPCS